MEGELLRQADRRAVAEEEARRLADAAIERIDANRTARRELLGVLGDPARPWIGASIPDPEIEEAIRGLAPRPRRRRRRRPGRGPDRARADRAPPRRRHGRAGLARPRRGPPLGGPRPRPDRQPARPDRASRPARRDRRPAPRLRPARDRAAGPRRTGVARSWPRSSGSTSPTRTRWSRSSPAASPRTGPSPTTPSATRSSPGPASSSSLSAGPLVVAPDLARGVPSDPATRAGRALALQLAGGRDRPRQRRARTTSSLIGGLTPWLARRRVAAGRPGRRRGRDPAGALPDARAVVRGAARVADRRRRRPVAGDRRPRSPRRSGPSMILRRPGDDAGHASRRRGWRRRSPASWRPRSSRRRSHGPALDHARATVAAATATLERLADDGWRAVLGDGRQGPERVRLGADCRRGADRAVRPVLERDRRARARRGPPPDRRSLSRPTPPGSRGPSRPAGPACRASACSPSTNTLMCSRSDRPAVDEPVAEPGRPRRRGRSIASATVAASTSVVRLVPGISDDERARQDDGDGHDAASVDLDRLDAPDRRQVVGDPRQLAPSSVEP